MFSNSLNTILALLLFLSLGCGLKIGEKNKSENVAEIQGSSCLTQSMDGLKLFFKGDATDMQISESIMCLQNVLISFKDNIRGKNQNSYTPEEIGNFLTKQFLKNGTDFNADLLAEIMNLKVVLVGGNTSAITKSEIDAIASIIARLKPDLIALNPHMKVIFSKWTPDTDSAMREKKFVDAKTAFEVFLNHIGLMLASTQRGYEIKDLINLAVEVAKFTNSTADSIKIIYNAKNFVIKFKLTLIGGNGALIGNEWIPFAKTLNEAFFQILRFKYFFNDLKDDQISEKWKVYENVATDISGLFQDLMTFKNSLILPNNEIISLLEEAKPLLINVVINADLIQQIGKLKIVILGNHEDGLGANSWSKNDFRILNKKAPVLFKNIGIILQNFKYLKTNKDGFRKNEIKYEDFNRAEQLAISSIGELSEQVEESYDLMDLKALIVNLSETLLKDSLKLPDNFAGTMELVKSAKYTLTGMLGSGVSKLAIQILLKVGFRTYAHYVEYTNFIDVFKLDEKEFSYNFDKLITKAKETLSLELNLKSNHIVSTEELSQLLLTAQTQKFLNTGFNQSGLNSLFKSLWENVLNPPENRLAKKVLPGLNGEALQVVSAELGFWIENQKIIADIFTVKFEYTKKDLLIELAKKTKTPSLAELYKVVSANGLMNFNEKGYLKILTDSNGLYHIKDLNNTNLARAISRIIIRAYANDPERISKLNGVILEEVQYAFDQLKPFVISIDLVDPEDMGFISSRFRESNLFLSVSNGDNISSFEEINHMVLHILSGIQRAESLKLIAMDKCLKAKNEVIFKTEFGQNCLLDVYFKEENSFSEMPGFAKLKSEKDEKGELRLSPEQNKAYYLGLLKAAGYVPNDKVPEEERTVFLRDANLFPHVIQYVEMIYFTHDADHDGYLQKEEAFKAYPIFAETMKPVQKQLNLEEKDMIGLFVWLLKKGTIFPINNMKKFVKDHECNLNNDSKTCAQDWTIKATRIDIGKIFNLIAALTAPKPPEPQANSGPSP